jgi:hypothetical protein
MNVVKSILSYQICLLIHIYHHNAHLLLSVIVVPLEQLELEELILFLMLYILQ